MTGSGRKIQTRLLREYQAASRLRDGAPEFFRGFDPFLDHDLDVGEGLSIRIPVSGAAGQLGNLSDERLVFVALVENNFVSRLRHLVRPLTCISEEHDQPA
jgi:hypothetical protein